MAYAKIKRTRHHKGQDPSRTDKRPQRISMETAAPPRPNPRETNEGEEVRTITAEIAKSLKKQKTERLESRKKTLKFYTLKWHPDKNPDNPELAKKVFQYIQETKTKFLED